MLQIFFAYIHQKTPHIIATGCEMYGVMEIPFSKRLGC